MSYELNVNVNGSRCKQYNHNGKTFIEAKHGSEYTIEIKNNTWERILAVCSVDGLDVLNGKKADENGNGYVINGYNSLKLDGFRVSNEKVAKFVFSTKDASYAASKGDESERNVGVIGVRLFAEKVKPKPIVKEIHHHHDHHHHDNWPVYPWKYPYNPPIIWGSTFNGTTSGTDSDMIKCSGDSTLRGDICDSFPVGTDQYSCDDIPTKGGTKGSNSAKGHSGNTIKARASNSNGRLMNAGGSSANLRGQVVSSNFVNETARGFDMGTRFGEAKESRVIEVEFEKGILTLTANIYYASRQSLIEMGVPLGNEKQVSFPDPFENGKYATPPKGWRE